LNNREIVCHISNTQKKKRVGEEFDNAFVRTANHRAVEKGKGIKNLSMKEDKGDIREHGLGEVIDRLVKRLDELEVETRSIRDALKEVGRGIERNKGEGREETKKPTSRKNDSWRVGDHITVKNAFRYRGSVEKRYGIKGIVTKVTEDWIWFKVLRRWRSEELWEDGYYRKRKNLTNKEWRGMVEGE